MGFYKPGKNELINTDSFYINFHFLLGKIIVNYNLIESKLILLICNIVDPVDITKGFLRCKRKGATQLLNLLSVLIKENIKDKETLKNYDNLQNELKEIIEHRNTFMHSIYLDTTNMKVNLTKKITKVRRIGIREFEKGKTTIDTSIIYELTPFQSLLQWLHNVVKKIDKFCLLLGKEIPINNTVFSIPEEPEFLKNKL